MLYCFPFIMALFSMLDIHLLKRLIWVFLLKYYRKDYRQVSKKPALCLILNHSKEFIIGFTPFRRKIKKVAVALIF